MPTSFLPPIERSIGPKLAPEVDRVSAAKTELKVLARRLGLNRISSEAYKRALEYAKLWKVSLEAAIRAVLHLNPELLGSYTGGKLMSLKEVGQRVHELTQAYCEVTNGEYWDCMKLVMKNHPELACKYLNIHEPRSVQGPNIPSKRIGGRPKPGVAGQRIDKLVRQYMEEHGVKSYETALRIVLKENRELVKEYAQTP
jgi:hypothetical protein